MSGIKALADKARLEAEVHRLRMLIAELVDPEPCWFDHNGGCQAHGYLSLDPDVTCPQRDAQVIAAEVDL